MSWDDVETWDDYLRFVVDDLGYTLTSENVRHGPPTAASKICVKGDFRWIRLQPANSKEVLKLRALRAVEKDCGHPPASRDER